MRTSWIHRFDTLIAEKPAKPGVWRRKDGGYVIRGRAKDPRTGKDKEVRRMLPDATAEAAYDTLQAELAAIRCPQDERVPDGLRFVDYAWSLCERKVVTGTLRSVASQRRYHYGLRQHLLPRFGDYLMIAIHRSDVMDYRDSLAASVMAGRYLPSTANGVLRLLLVILRAFVKQYDLDRDPTRGVTMIDTSTHRTYTREQPNSLLPDELPRFLTRYSELYPHEFAMVALGFAIGLRPSSLRPLRRKGPNPDVLLDEGFLLNRRSHVHDEHVMERTKTGIDQEIALPPELVELLRWHIEHLPAGPMQDSDLLFPHTDGDYKPTACLVPHFAKCAGDIGLTKHITPRAMRRTSKDLLRLAGASQVVAMAINGHTTEKMHRHYSTVSEAEQRSSLAKVLRLGGILEAKPVAEVAAPGGGKRGGKADRSRHKRDTTSDDNHARKFSDRKNPRGVIEDE